MAGRVYQGYQFFPALRPALRLVLCAALLAIGLSSCLQMRSSVGYAFDPKKVEQIKVGETPRPVVANILGSPSTVSDYGQVVWFYVFSDYARTGFLNPDLMEQKVLKITFDAQDMVSSMQYFGKDDIYDVAISREETPITSSDLTITQQLLGNVGRFNNRTGALSRRHTPGQSGSRP